MVKAVNMDESPNTLGNPPKKSNSETVSILNPDDDVEFVIDTGSDDLNIDAVSKKAMGGTELMQKWLFRELEKRDLERPKEEDIRKETMKIGKFLKKGERLAARREELANEIEKVREELAAAHRERSFGDKASELGEKRDDLYRELRDAKVYLDNHMSHSAPPLFSKRWQ